MINLIRDNILLIELSHALQLVFAHDNAGGIGRRIDQNCLGPVREFLFNIIWAIRNPLPGNFSLFNLAACREDEVLVAG